MPNFPPTCPSIRHLALTYAVCHIAKMVRIDHHEYLTEEEKRLKEDRQREKYWKRWGPYVAERQWATGKCP